MADMYYVCGVSHFPSSDCCDSFHILGAAAKQSRWMVVRLWYLNNMMMLQYHINFLANHMNISQELQNVPATAISRRRVRVNMGAP